MSWCNITPAWALVDIKKYYVYAHVHPVTKKTFYIGKGTGNRAYDLKGRNKRWREVHEELKEIGLAHEIKILHICDSDKEVRQKEKEETRKLALTDDLTNILTYPNESKKTELLESLGNFIKELRTQRGMTQAQLGKIARCPQTTISKIEIGTLNITLKTFNRIMNALGMDINFQKREGR